MPRIILIAISINNSKTSDYIIPIQIKTHKIPVIIRNLVNNTMNINCQFRMIIINNFLMLRFQDKTFLALYLKIIKITRIHNHFNSFKIKVKITCKHKILNTHNHNKMFSLRLTKIVTQYHQIIIKFVIYK